MTYQIYPNYTKWHLHISIEWLHDLLEKVPPMNEKSSSLDNRCKTDKFHVHKTTDIIQIMTDHEGNRKIYLARGIQEGLETVDYCPRRSRG